MPGDAVLLYQHTAPDHHAASMVGAFLIDDAGAAENVLNLQDAAFDAALFHLGVVVFRVVLAGTLLLCVVDHLGNFTPADAQLFELVLELCFSFTCQRNGLIGHVVP